MIDFELVRAGSLDEAVRALAGDEEAKLLAGGQSLLPLMKLGMAQPATLVDLAGVAGLSYVRDEGEHLAIGALTTHHALATDPLARSRCRVLAETAAAVGDPAVRHRGTIGGSLAHADPAGDLPAVLLALQAEVTIIGPAGTRAVAVDDLFTGLFETAIQPGEILTEIRVPAADRGTYIKFAHRSLDWATVGVAVASRSSGTRVALANMGDRPLRATGVESALAGGASAAEAAARADEGTEPPDDEKASPEHRRALAAILTRRALERVL